MLSLLFLLIIFFQHLIKVNNVGVGIINNVSLNLPVWSTRLTSAPTLNGTCTQCLCAVMTNSPVLNSISSIGVGSFNCFINNNTCQFFSSGTFYEFWLNNDTDTNYYVFQLPTRLNDSDLVAWHSFDGGSHNDSSGNQLNAIQVVDVSSAPGRINEAVNFSLTSSLYEIGGFTQLGQSNQPYSIALWIQPQNINEAPIVHLSSQSDGQGWCIDMLGFLGDGQIVTRCWQLSPVIVNGSVLVANVWFHIAATYFPSIGLQLYINGILVDQSQSFFYSASNQNNYVTLANPLASRSGSSCASGMIANSGTYQGLIDELRIYSKALSTGDIYALANP